MKILVPIIVAVGRLDEGRHTKFTRCLRGDPWRLTVTAWRQEVNQQIISNLNFFRLPSTDRISFSTLCNQGHFSSAPFPSREPLSSWCRNVAFWQLISGESWKECCICMRRQNLKVADFFSLWCEEKTFIHQPSEKLFLFFYIFHIPSPVAMFHDTTAKMK